MKFSDRDVTILENFTIINPSVQFKAGNIQKTVSTSKSVMLKVKLDVEFDRDFAIYDLSRFLRTLKLLDDYSIHLEENHMVLKGPQTTVKYIYCAPETIFSINQLKSQQDVVLPSIDANFVLTGVTYQKLTKAISTLGVKNIAVVGENGKLFVETHDSEKRILDNLRMEIGQTSGKFNYVFSSDNLKLIPGDYSVEISDAGMSKFIGMPGTFTENMVYWVAQES
jgi:hypothetical protein